MAAPTQGQSGYYVWEVPGGPVIVQIRLDVVDRLAAEVMGGYSAVPKRGAEVGGVLIGTIRPGLPAIVRIDDYEPVACEYRRGPSYLFTDEDIAAFEDCWERWRPGASPSLYSVGYFRSHTRDGLCLGSQDLELMDQFFPGTSDVALLIKPYATQVSAAGFFIREHGVFPQTTPLEFPLHGRELLDEEPPPRAMAPPESTEADFAFSQEPAIASAGRALRQRSWGSGWVWLPLTFVFLLLGAVLGYQLAVTIGTRAAASSGEDFSLALSVTKSGDNLSVNWSRLSPAVRLAQRGTLEIEDGGYTKPVALDAAQLQNGTLIYRNSSNSVRFRLTVYPQARVSVVETLEWKQ